jgi:hypothetical protein
MRRIRGSDQRSRRREWNIAVLVSGAVVETDFEYSPLSIIRCIDQQPIIERHMRGRQRLGQVAALQCETMAGRAPIEFRMIV